MAVLAAARASLNVCLVRSPKGAVRDLRMSKDVSVTRSNRLLRRIAFIAESWREISPQYARAESNGNCHLYTRHLTHHYDIYQGAPIDGSAWMTGDCSQHGRRGGSWYRVPLQASTRSFLGDGRHVNAGFRVARDP